MIGSVMLSTGTRLVATPQLWAAPPHAVALTLITFLNTAVARAPQTALPALSQVAA